MDKRDPIHGLLCKKCKRDVFDLCEKCGRWGCYKCDFRPRGMKDRALCVECANQESFWEANSVAAKKKTKMGPVKITKLKKPKEKPAPKTPRAPKADVAVPAMPKKPVRPQSELFPLELKPVPRKVESPGVDPAAPAAPTRPIEPSIAKDISTPPEGAFTAPFIEGSLAHHLNHPENRVDGVIDRTFKKKRYPWISEYTGAADAGDPCIRKLVYQRLMPEAALPDDGEMTFLFKHGQWVEREVYDEMAQAGYEVVEQQRPFVDTSLMVKGKIDGKLMVNHAGKRIRPPFEIKGYAPYTWDQINSAKDMLDAHQGYLKKVPAQVTLYLVLDKEQEADSAILFMKNKLTGKPKTIIVPRDEKYAEWLLHRLQLVRQHVQAKTLPARIEFEESSCGKCPFRGVCLKEMPAGPNPLVLDPEKQAMLLELLEEWWKMNPARKVWKELDDKIGLIVRNHPKIILGDFIVTGTPGTQTRVDSKAMSKEHRALYEKETPTWRKGIVNVKDVKGSGVLE